MTGYLNRIQSAGLSVIRCEGTTAEIYLDCGPAHDTVRSAVKVASTGPPVLGADDAESSFSARLGAEYPSDLQGNSEVSETGGAESGAVDVRNAEETASRSSSNDSELARLVKAWPALPDNIREMIVALVTAATHRIRRQWSATPRVLRLRGIERAHDLATRKKWSLFNFCSPCQR